MIEMTEQEIKVASNYINYLLDSTILPIATIAEFAKCPIDLVEKIVAERWKDLTENNDFATGYYEAKEFAKESK